jgi:hypothetical protein
VRSLPISGTAPGLRSGAVTEAHSARALSQAQLVRPRIPVAVARRIDRLARAVHRAHRYAHHPLCGAYAGELVRVGRRGRVCRGCLLVACGACAGVALTVALPAELAAFAWHAPVGLALAPGFACAGAALLDAWRPRTAQDERPQPRRPARKLLTRLLPAAVLTAGIALGLRRADLPGIALAAFSAAAIAAVWAGYRKRGPDRSPCARCPEGPPHAGCSGFAPIVRRERAFQRLSSRLLRQRA